MSWNKTHIGYFVDILTESNIKIVYNASLAQGHWKMGRLLLHEKAWYISFRHSIFGQEGSEWKTNILIAEQPTAVNMNDECYEKCTVKVHIFYNIDICALYISICWHSLLEFFSKKRCQNLLFNVEKKNLTKITQSRLRVN